MKPMNFSHRVLALTVVAVASLAGCGGGSETSSTPSQSFVARIATETPVTGSLPATASAPKRSAAAVAITNDQLFQWAQLQYPELFGTTAPNVIANLPYNGKLFDVREFPGGAYLGISEGRVFGLGSFTNGQLTDFGVVQTYSTQVCSRVSCGGTPDPVTALSTGFEQSGVLNYFNYDANDSNEKNMKAVVEYTAPNGKVTFSGASGNTTVATTTDSWNTITWPSGYSAAARANGNTGLMCSNGTSIVAVSQNMVPVADHTVLRGKSFERTRCQSGVIEKLPNATVFNVDGTVLGDNGITLTATQVDKLFTAAGLDLGNNINLKLRLYSYTAGGQTQFQIVRVYEDGLSTNSGRSASLFSAAP